MSCTCVCICAWLPCPPMLPCPGRPMMADCLRCILAYPQPWVAGPLPSQGMMGWEHRPTGTQGRGGLTGWTRPGPYRQRVSGPNPLPHNSHIQPPPTSLQVSSILCRGPAPTPSAIGMQSKGWGALPLAQPAAHPGVTAPEACAPGALDTVLPSWLWAGITTSTSGISRVYVNPPCSSKTLMPSSAGFTWGRFGGSWHLWAVSW